MEDVAPILLEQIKELYKKESENNERVELLLAKIIGGDANYIDAGKYADELGEILSKAYKETFVNLPDGKMYYNIAKRTVEPTMKDLHSEILDYTDAVQSTLNEQAGLGINPIRPELEQNKIDGILNRLSHAETFDDISWILDEPIKTFARSTVDDAIKSNAEFHAKAGMSPKIVRKMAGDCCDWCKAVAGEYSYPNVPKDVYRRHQRCRCTVDYVVGKRKQNVWTKAWSDEVEPEKIEQRKAIKYGEDIENIGKSDTIEVQKAEPISVDDFPTAFKAKTEVKNTKTLVDYVNGIEGANPDTIKLYKSMGKMESIESQGIPFKISHASGYAVQTTRKYSGELVEAKLIIPKLKGENLAGQVQTTLHEEMHLIDLYLRQDKKMYSNWFSSSRTALVDTFKNTSSNMSDEVKTLFADFKTAYKETSEEIRKAYKQKIDDLRDSYFPNGESIWSDISKYKKYDKEANKLRKEMADEIDYQNRNLMGGGLSALQDIYDALSGGSFRDNGTVIYGHGSKYYRNADARIHETLANYGSLSVTRPDLIELLRADKPELVAELEATVKEMLVKVGE